MSALRRSNPSPIPVRPKSKLTQIPVVVDLSRLNHNSTHRSLVIKDIARACRKHGYFQEAKLVARKLRKELDEGMQLLAVHSYPPFSQPDVMVGLYPHSDFGFITILHQSCHGLEVMEHDDKCWRAAPHQHGAFHVHIGDHLEVLSNGEFKTLVHRAVLNPDNRRISIASIHSLSIDEKVSTAKELIEVCSYVLLLWSFSVLLEGAMVLKFDRIRTILCSKFDNLCGILCYSMASLGQQQQQ